MDNLDTRGVFGEDATKVADALRAETPRPFLDMEGIAERAQEAVVGSLPVVADVRKFVDPKAGIADVGRPAPGLVRGVLDLIERTRNAARTALTSAFAEAQPDIGAVSRSGPTAVPPSAPRNAISTGEASTLAAETTRAHAHELVQAAIASARKDRSSLSPLGKFVSAGAQVSPQGEARGIAPVASLAARLAMVGAIAGLSVTIPDSAAYADWSRGHYRQDRQFRHDMYRHDRQRFERRERRDAAVAAGIGIVAGVLAGKAMGQGYANGYAPQRFVPNNNYVPPRSYGYDTYGGVAPYRPYAAPVAMPSDNFILAAKTVVAARIGSVRGADDVIDRALIAGRSCVQQMGPQPRCTVSSNGVTFDFANSHYVAADRGQPIISETNGMIRRIRPDLLQSAFFQAKEIKAQEDYGSGYGGGYGRSRY